MDHRALDHALKSSCWPGVFTRLFRLGIEVVGKFFLERFKIDAARAHHS